MESNWGCSLMSEPLLTTGYSIAVFGPINSESNLLDGLDFGSLSIADPFDGKQWNNTELNKIPYHRYMALTDEEIIKYGTAWLFELITGDMTCAGWFAEWTLLLTLQMKSPIDGETRLFADFLVGQSLM